METISFDYAELEIINEALETLQIDYELKLDSKDYPDKEFAGRKLMSIMDLLEKIDY